MNEGFQIRDKRRLDPEGNLKQEYFEEPKPEPEPKPKQEPPKPEASPPPPPQAEFISLLMNLSTMAYSALGLLPNSKKVNLNDARYIIDTIAVLEEKTKGNLTPEEEKTLKSLLYELKMNYSRVIEKARPK